MATTSSNLVAGKAIGGQAGNGKGGRQFGLREKLFTGVAVLGCAAMLTFGELRVGEALKTQQSAVAQAERASVSADFWTALQVTGRTGPADEYIQAEIALAPQGTRATHGSGPADEYTPAETAIVPQATHGSGAADEYTQVEFVVVVQGTHGDGPADEYLER